MELRENKCFKWLWKLVALFDLSIGMIGIIWVMYLLCSTFVDKDSYITGIKKPPLIATDVMDIVAELNYDLKIYAILYIFPSVVTFVLGINVIIAIAKQSFKWSRIALLLNILLVVGSCGILTLVFCSGVTLDVLVPLFVPTLLQGGCIFIVYDLYKKSQHVVKFI